MMQIARLKRHRAVERAQLACHSPMAIAELNCGRAVANTVLHGHATIHGTRLPGVGKVRAKLRHHGRIAGAHLFDQRRVERHCSACHRNKDSRRSYLFHPG